MRPLSLLVLSVALLAGCSKGTDVSGKWHIEQTGTGFGPGAENTELELRTDGKFEIMLGPVRISEGTWKFDGTKLTLDSPSNKMGPEYRLENGKLIPVLNGKDVEFWRFVRK